MTLAPAPEVSAEARERGLQKMIVEAGFSNACAAVTTGVILTAFALYLKASNFAIGLLAAAPFLMQVLQAPTVLLIERLRARKRIAVWASVTGRTALGLMAVLAVIGPSAATVSTLLALQFVYCAMGAVGGCAWNAWIKDLVPEHRLGAVFARRTTYATAVSLAAGLVAAFTLDRFGSGPMQAWTFAGLYAFGFVFGQISVAVVARIPEPGMPPPGETIRLLPLLRAPLKDRNFRRLIAFLASWQFAVNLATPFFTVFFVRQLGFSMTFVMGLSVLTQVANLVALRSWGLLSDRFTNKSVLSVAAPVYIVCIAGMILASQLTDRTMIGVYLVGLHLLMGLAVAGVTLTSANIALKLSPTGSATAYIATNALITNLAAGSAPILGGLFADFFAARRLEVVLRWTSPDGVLAISPFRLSNWDFYFLIAAALGLYALHRLSLVREKGEIDRRAMVTEVMLQARRSVRNLSPVAGLKMLGEFPASLLRDGRARERLLRMRARRDFNPSIAGAAPPSRPRASP
ncbi:MAG: MFS transporter [Caulobacterales bacterium]|nr:MFS transporter [Caulobacterales bacterium]